MNLSLKLNTLYLDANVKTVLNAGFDMFQNPNNNTVFCGNTDEVDLSFTDMPTNVIGALVQIRACAIYNNKDHNDFDVIERACNGKYEKLTLRTFVNLIMCAEDVPFDRPYPVVELLEVTYKDDLLNSLTLYKFEKPFLVKAINEEFLTDVVELFKMSA